MFEIIHVLQRSIRVRGHLGMHLRTQAMLPVLLEMAAGWRCKTIHSLGFDEHCLWHIRGAQKERYVSPMLLTNGASIEYPGRMAQTYSRPMRSTLFGGMSISLFPLLSNDSSSLSLSTHT